MEQLDRLERFVLHESNGLDRLGDQLKSFRTDCSPQVLRYSPSGEGRVDDFGARRGSHVRQSTNRYQPH